ncbi:TetR/AcrR family transcriptional regulator [Nocardia sp. NPDC050710]|uniref:TetR/AcrR family transcriptional regulator n=1 Tax=Nocardia sp. NPDC050710 TaxID=3157220 RepID=UPI003404EF50
MAESPQARERMVAGAADMIRRRGLNATSVRELAKHSNTPLGSTYHYFPGGKSQLAVEAVQFADALAARKLAKELPAGPVNGLRAFVDMWRKVVLDSDFQAGCPVLAVAVEDPADDGDAPQRAAATAFRNWTTLLADSLRAHGASDIDAEQTATVIVAAIEGTVAMCRVERSTRPLDQTVDKLELLVRAVTGAEAT